MQWSQFMSTRRDTDWFAGLLTAEEIVHDYGYEIAIKAIAYVVTGVRKKLDLAFDQGLNDYLESEAFRIVKAQQEVDCERIHE